MMTHPTDSCPWCEPDGCEVCNGTGEICPICDCAVEECAARQDDRTLAELMGGGG